MSRQLIHPKFENFVGCQPRSDGFAMLVDGHEAALDFGQCATLAGPRWFYFALDLL
jgi:hypothetical protein